MFLPPGINDVRGHNCPIKGTHLTPWCGTASRIGPGPLQRVLDPAPTCFRVLRCAPSWPIRTSPAAPIASRLAHRPWWISAIAAVSAPCFGWGSWWIRSSLSGRWLSRRCRWIFGSWRCCPIEGFGCCGPLTGDGRAWGCWRCMRGSSGRGIGSTAPVRLPIHCHSVPA